MGRLNLLIKNVFYFGGLKILSSLFPLILYPYITKKLVNPAEFGLYDIFLVFTSLSSSISMLGVHDAMFKQYHDFDSPEHKKLVVSTGFGLVLLTSLVFSLGLILLRPFYQARILNDSSSYDFIYLASIYVIINNVTNIIVHPSRLNNNKKQLLYYTFLFALIFYLTAVIFLNYNPSFLSLVYGNFCTVIFLALIFGKINSRFFFPFRFSKKTAVSLLKIGVPLVPIFIIYWANSSILRVLIIKNLGAKELGVFAIGSKYAGISSFIQAAFAGGWSFFTFSTMKDKDQMEIKSKIFESLLLIIVLAYALISPFMPYLFKMLFSGEYVRGYTVFGQLFLGPLLLILYQIIANQFTIIEKSYYSFIALLIGFFIGVATCIFLIHEGFGIVGASFSIPISYMIAIFLVYLFGRKYNLFMFSRYVYISFLFLALMNIAILLTHGVYTFAFLSIIVLVYLLINQRHLLLMFNLLSPYLKRGKVV